MTHPTHTGGSFVRMMGVESYSFEFTGKASHAAAEPWNGLNALDAVVNMYQGCANLLDTCGELNLLIFVL
jgi:metal-dependent amidase/aminoacylase/carboxypeptidase family protein